MEDLVKDYIYNKTNDEVYEDTTYKVCDTTFKLLKVNNPILNITFVDEEEIHSINKKYRNMDRPTDVISFAFEDNANIEYDNVRILGEIYVCTSIAKKQSIEYGHSYERELNYLCVHGLLHLLGYNHETDEDREVMRKIEEEVLNKIGLTR